MGGLLAGCATPGPTHVYLAGPEAGPIWDRPAEAPHEAVALPGFVAAGERVVGLAYDYNTDYLWLRVMPGDLLRVVNRPARRVEAEHAAATGDVALDAGSLDLAIRSADRRVFAVAGDGLTVVVFHRQGHRLRSFAPGGGTADARIGGLAYDQTQDRLLVLWHDEAGRAWVAWDDRTGGMQYKVELPPEVRPHTLGFDDNARHLLVPLAEERGLGRFDTDGRKVGREDLPPGDWAIDAGQRSLLRLF